MNIVQLRTNSILRQAMVRPLSGLLPSYTISEFPKCGGSWLGQMLSAALELPFPRNQFPKIRSNVMHGHYLHPWGMKNVVVMWRDPRDVVVSFYYHCYVKNEHDNGFMVDFMKEHQPFNDYEDIKGNLPEFIRRIYQQPLRPRFSYSQFINNWYGREGVVYTSYEKLRGDTPAELTKVVHSLTGKNLTPDQAEKIAEQYSFEKLTKRKPGEENKKSFLRSGKAGAWVKNFTPQARNAMHKVAQSELVKLGYETDDGWLRG